MPQIRRLAQMVLLKSVNLWRKSSYTFIAKVKILQPSYIGHFRHRWFQWC